MYQVLRQPDGNMAVFNIVAWDFEIIDSTIGMILDFLIEKGVVEGRDGLDTEIQRSVVVNGGWPSLDMDWDRACAFYEEYHGEAFDLDAARTSDDWEDWGDGLEDFYGYSDR